MMAGIVSESRRALLGRATELADLEGALQCAREGRPALCVISGEAGVGKTRLLSAFAEEAASCGTRTLVGRCVPIAVAELPFAAILEAFRRVGDDLRLPGAAAASPSGQRRVFERCLATIGRLARERPLVLGVEDLHWADRSTLDLLAFLARNVRDEPVMIVLTCRSDELTPDSSVRRWLAEAPRLRPVLRLDLPRLTRAETVAQLSELLGQEPDADLVDAVYARSEGNPLVTEALVAASGTDVTAIPASLREMVLGRLAGLPEPTRALLRLAAAAGREVRHVVLAALAGQPEEEVLLELRAAVDKHVLVPSRDGESYGFRHALIRDVVYEDTLPAERRRLHAMLARALTERPALRAVDEACHAAEIAYHWYAAGDRGRALPAAARAGLGAMQRYGFAEALHQLQRCLDLWDDLPDADRLAGMDRVAVACTAADAAHLLGEHDRAVSLMQTACGWLAADEQPRRVAGIHNQLGRCHYKAGRRAQAAEAYQRAITVLDGEPASAERAQALAGLAKILVAWSELDHGARLAAEAIGVAQQVSARREEGRARNVRGLALAHAGDLDAGLAELQHALAIAEDLDDPDDIALGYANTGYVLGLAARHDEAVQVALRGHRAMCRLGLERQDGSFLQANAAGELFASGQWDQAAQLLAEAEARGARGACSFSVSLYSAQLRTARGDFAGARQRLDQLDRLLAEGGFTSWRRCYLEQVAETAVWERRLTDVRAAVTEGLTLYAGTGEDHFAGTLVAAGLRAEADAADRARAYRDQQALTAALAAGEQLIRKAHAFCRNPLDPKLAVLPEGRPVAYTCLAEMGRLRNCGEPAPWLAAATAWDELGRPFPAAYARFRAAETLLRRDGTTAQATATLRAATQAARLLGAQPLITECELLAQWHRITLQVALVADRCAAAPVATGGLTKREREILELVAAGRTNGEIANTLVISPKTVSVHVSNILRKLGVARRTDAARVGHQTGLVAKAPTCQ